MANNTVRTIVIFGLITLILGGAVVGAVRLFKARNNSYATAQTQPVTPPQQQVQSDQKKEEQQPSANQNPQTTAPAPASAPATTPTPSQTSTNSSTPADAGATPNGSIPATGPAEDFLMTTALLSLATFFTVKIVKTRADYRRYVGS